MNLIEEAKKEIEQSELEAKKAKIKKMLVLIQNEEKTMAAEQKAHENYVEQKQKRIAELKEKLEKEDYGEVEYHDFTNFAYWTCSVNGERFYADWSTGTWQPCK